MKTQICFLAGLFISFQSNAQMSGNQVYTNNGYYGNNNAVIPNPGPVLMGDSAILISANVLLTTLADNYIVTIGLNQEGKTVKECNDLINKRIDAFKTAVQKINVSAKDLYVDFVSQTKVYDFTVAGNKATEFQNGFEIKKNIILKLNSLSAFDDLVVLASENGIYDIVKVDYVVNDNAKIYNQMMNTAAEIIKQKKETYLKISSFELTPVSKVYSENFYSVFPNTQYKTYEAYETSTVSNQGYYSTDPVILKEKRKNRTFYYNGVDRSGFDNIINQSEVTVGVQFVLNLKIKFTIKKVK